jgi:predicted Rossmann-fold nucleotide-binding protein
MAPIESEIHPSSPAHSKGKPARIVAVFGAAFLEEDSPAHRTAMSLGAEITRLGWAVASGGYGGTMAENVFCWVQIQTGELSLRPLLASGPAWRETFDAFLHASGKHIREEDRELLMFSAPPQDAVERIGEFLFSQT